MQAGRDSGYPLKATTLVSGPKPMSEAGKDRGAARYHCRSVLGNSPCSRHSIVFREATLLASPPLSILYGCRPGATPASTLRFPTPKRTPASGRPQTGCVSPGLVSRLSSFTRKLSTLR
jgi:hypothetical protein